MPRLHELVAEPCAEADGAALEPTPQIRRAAIHATTEGERGRPRWSHARNMTRPGGSSGNCQAFLLSCATLWSGMSFVYESNYNSISRALKIEPIIISAPSVEFMKQ